jgi:hypothetical protein
MSGSRKLSFVVSLLVLAATCMCVCTDSGAAPVASTPAHSCCDVDHALDPTKESPAQHPGNHDNCRACGLKIWSGARVTAAVPVDLHNLAMPVALIPTVFHLAAPFDSTPLSVIDSPPPPPTLLALHCQLTC